MSYTIEFLEHNQPSIRGEVPVGLEDFHIRGSLLFSITETSGKMLAQEISIDEFIIYYFVLVVEKDISIRIKSPKSLLHGCIALDGNFILHEKKMGDISMVANHFNIVNLKQVDITCSFAKGNAYKFLIIQYPAKYIHRLLLQYPLLEYFDLILKDSEDGVLSVKPIEVNTAILKKSFLLTNTPYLPQLNKFHIETLEELSLLLLKQASELRPLIKYTPQETEQFYAVKDLIDRYFPKHLTNQQIARKIGINRQKLKLGFKDIFNKTVSSYQQEQKMSIAKVQLEESNKLVKEIAKLVGYKNEANFCIAFKKVNGMTPLQFRAQHKRLK